jgi:integrase
MRGHIQRRGKQSWRLKFDLGCDPLTGKRKTRYVTVRGKRADAERELRAVLYRHDKGVAIDPSKITVAQFLDEWLSDVASQRVAPKSLERYRGLVENQIKPHLGTIPLQKLRPANVAGWIQTLIGLGKLSTRSIRHAHGVLRTALNHAAAIEVVERNVASIIKPPTLERSEITTLKEDEIADTLEKMEGHSLYPIVALAIGTGARRGEIAALRWSDLDIDAATVRIERSLEQTKDGLRIKPPKTAAGRRTLSLPAFTVKAVREHRRQQLELRLALGAGTLPADMPVFGDVEGNWPSPYSITDRWRDAIKSRKIPKVTFHALRHSHASALIAAGLDVVTVSRRLGHASPALTLSVYSHLFNNKDEAAALAIDDALSK